MADATGWIDRQPRKVAFTNVLITAFFGLFLGLLMGLFAISISSAFSKVWVYAINTFAVLLLRVTLQWLWVLRLAPSVHSLGQYLVKRRTGRDIPEKIRQKHFGEEQVARSIVPAIVSVAIATLLATEELAPSWLNQTWTMAVIAASGGGVSSALVALSVPDNIYAIIHNRHRYQETQSFQSGAIHGNRANRRRS